MLSSSVLEHEILLKKQSVRVIFSTLCICTYRRAAELETLLSEIFRMQNLPSEIIVVDGSGDREAYNRIEKLVLESRKDLDFIYVFSPAGLTLQRNVGLDISKGEIIHFIDDDCIPQSDYFENIDLFFKENVTYGAVTGNILNEYSFKPSFKHRLRIWFRLYPANGIPGIYYCNGSSVPKGLISPPKTNIDLDIVSGASMSFRKSILNEVGGFSPFFNGYGQGEDLEISLRVKRISKIVLLSNAKCNHYHTPSSRPNLFKKGFMEVFNRYYIWHFNVPNKKFSCRVKFWGDICLLQIYALSLFVKSGFKLIYFEYFIGYLKGTLTTLTSRFSNEIYRDNFYSLERDE